MRRTPAEASTDRDYLERAFTGAAYGSAPDVAAPAVPETSGRSSPNKAPAQSRTDVPVFVMLPLDTVSPDGAVQNPKALQASFQALRVAGVTGVMVDVWWGVVERRGPCLYDWEPYQQIVGMAKKAGLQLQAVMSFHACGGNVGDDIHIPLPQWVHEAAAKDPAIFYTDRAGYQNPECVSLFSDDVPCLAGRTPIQAYTDFMAKFREAMGEDFGTVVREIAVGAGPCGELRYPAYPEGDGRWQFPGVGEFQCYDERALAALRSAAELEGRPHWGLSGPHDSGHYNSRPDETGFFSWDGSWSSDYGQFFLQWYAASLVSHGERMLQAAHAAVYDISPHEPPSADGPAAWGGYPPPGVVKVSIKCAGIHWWYCTRVHAAELTAGYNNTWGRNGYAAIIDLCARYGAHLNFTCCEMRNAEQPPAALCGPQELLNQVRVCAAQKGVVLAGENALARLDHAAYDQMVHNACAGKVTLDEVDELGNVTTVEHHAPAMGAVTFLRLTPSLFQERNFVRFISFIRRMKQGSPAPHRDHDHAHPQDHIMYA